MNSVLAVSGVAARRRRGFTKWSGWESVTGEATDCAAETASRVANGRPRASSTTGAGTSRFARRVARRPSCSPPFSPCYNEDARTWRRALPQTHAAAMAARRFRTSRVRIDIVLQRASPARVCTAGIADRHAPPRAPWPSPPRAVRVTLPGGAEELAPALGQRLAVVAGQVRHEQRVLSRRSPLDLRPEDTKLALIGRRASVLVHRAAQLIILVRRPLERAAVRPFGRGGGAFAARRSAPPCFFFLRSTSAVAAAATAATEARVTRTGGSAASAGGGSADFALRRGGARAATASRGEAAGDGRAMKSATGSNAGGGTVSSA